VVVKREIQQLRTALTNLVGNKVYLRDLIKLLDNSISEKKDLQTIMFLVRDLKFIDINNNKRSFTFNKGGRNG